MPKKIIDIIPPDEFEKAEPAPSKKVAKKPKKKRRFKKFIVFLIFIFIIAIIYCSVSSNVEIEIQPKMSSLKSEFRVNVDRQAGIDLSNRIVPGYTLEEQNSFSQEFPSSGKVTQDQKAKGTIRVYNDYSGLSQSLRANTRFMAASGEIFRTPTQVIIPGRKMEGGKEVSGFVDVKVVADKTGSDYNIEPTTFSIPGLAGTALYTKLYGKSFTPMSGGSEGEAPQVTEEDLEKAESIVVRRLKIEGENILEKKAGDSGFVFLKEVLEQEVKATSSPVEAGAIARNFEFSAKVKSTALLFKKEDAEKLILDQVPEDKKLHKDSLDMNWRLIEVDLEQGKITLDLKSSGNIYFDIGQWNLEEELRGKTISEAKLILEEKPEISEVWIDSWPFWVKKIPWKSDRIKIRLKLD